MCWIQNENNNTKRIVAESILADVGLDQNLADILLELEDTLQTPKCFIVCLSY